MMGLLYFLFTYTFLIYIQLKCTLIKTVMYLITIKTFTLFYITDSDAVSKNQTVI